MTPPRVPNLTVTVPATTANLGAGFDVLGLALSLYNVFQIEQAERTEILVNGFGDELALDETNLFCRSFAALYELRGQQTPPLRIEMDVKVPPGRGLGSSATAVVGGLMAANAALGNPYAREELIPLAVQLEHGTHADNVAAALLGGLVVNAWDGGEVISLGVNFPPGIKAALFVPDFSMDTVQGRGLMPAGYPRADVVFSTARVGLFIAALAQERYELLQVAMQDRIHQPYRARLFPMLSQLINEANSHGAYGSCLSGGGSAVLALAGDNAAQVAAAMAEAARKEGIEGTCHVLEIDRDGARVEDHNR